MQAARAARVPGARHAGAGFGLPGIEPHYPTAAGLVAAVGNWAAEPGPLLPLYLRRPDAKTLAERGVAR